MITDVRTQVESAVGRLLVLLAESYIARRQPGAAIPHLEQAHRLVPEQESVARKLIATYEQEGLLRNAANLRNAIGLPTRS